MRAFERALDGAGVTLGLEESRAHGVDLGAGICAREVRQAVERALAWTAETGEEVLRKRGRVWADPRGFAHQASVSREGLKSRSLSVIVNVPFRVAIAWRSRVGG